jgi:hypothetical protein
MTPEQPKSSPKKPDNIEDKVVPLERSMELEKRFFCEFTLPERVIDFTGSAA